MVRANRAYSSLHAARLCLPQPNFWGYRMNRSELSRARDLLARARAINDLVKMEQRGVTEKEAERIDALLDEYESITGSRGLVDVAEDDLEARVQADEVNSSRRSAPNPIGSNVTALTAARQFGAPAAPNTYAALFGVPKASSQWAGGGVEMLKVLSRRLNDSRLVNASMSEGSGPAGGYLVPPHMVSEMMDESLKQEVFRPLVRNYAMEGPGLVLTVPNIADRSAGTAGLRLNFVKEGATSTAQQAQFRSMELAARMAAVYVRASMQLVEDALDFNGQISSLFAGEIARGLDYYTMHGTGAGQPLGILNSSSLVTVSKEGSQAAATVLSANIFKMWGRLAPWLHRDAVWVCSPSVLPQLYAMSVPVNDAAGTQTYGGSPVFTSSNGGIAQAPAGTLLGRPLLISDVAQPLGTKGDIILFSPSQYALGIRRDMAIEVSNAPGWTTAEIDFRVLFRFDGQPMWEKAVTPVKGSDTLSWAVALETR
jgi:HK97 family phage major capsid protein